MDQSYPSSRVHQATVPQLRVAIVYVCQSFLATGSLTCYYVHFRGAGIGGLMLASCIAQMDKQKKIEVDIYEAASTLSEIGAGINLWPRGFELLAKAGVEQDILRFCERANADSCSFPFLIPPHYCLHQVALAFQFRKSDQKNGHHILDTHVKGSPGPAICS